jgi:hypothetical protein
MSASSSKNYIRASFGAGFGKGFRAVESVRAEAPIGALREVASTLAYLPNSSSLALRTRRSVSDLYTGYPLKAVSFERELAWCTGLLVKHVALLRNFREAAAALEQIILAGDINVALEGLAHVERTFGYSNWALELRIALLQLIGGLEAVKAGAIIPH